MAQPPIAPPPATDEGDLDLRLAIKSAIPPVRADFMPRARLVEAVNQGMGRVLSLISAPPGFGKTTMLAHWARNAGWPVAWVSLDRDDNDPARFWRYMSAAIGRVRSEAAEQMDAIIGGPNPPPARRAATAVANSVGAIADDLALVLDDYHVIESGAIHEGISLLLGWAPPQLHVMVSSRAVPPLPIARLRAGAQLAELRSSDLQFTPGEAAAFFTDVFGLDLPRESAAALAARTEGWPAGLQLAALSLRERPDAAVFIREFSGSNRYVFDYLTEEVLDRLPGEMREFLLQTSVLERLCGQLSDALTGRSDGQRVLELMDRANLFVVPLDEQRRWYRYHNLFADVLQARLQRSHPDLVPELHRRAAVWYEAHGLIDEALHHILVPGDVEEAADLIEKDVEGLLLRAEACAAGRWLVQLPSDLVRSRPLLSAAQAAIAMVTGQMEDVEPLLQQAKRAYTAAAGSPREPDSPSPAGLDTVAATIPLLLSESARQRGDTAAAARFAEQASRAVPAGHPYEDLVHWNVAASQLMQGQAGQAEKSLADLVAERRRAGRAYHAVLAGFMLGQARRARGRLESALDAFRQCLDMALEMGGSSFQATVSTLRPGEDRDQATELHSPSSAVAGIAHTGMAAIFRERNELEAALRHAERGAELCEQLLYFQYPVTSLATLASVRLALGDQAGAARAIRQAERVEPPPQTLVDLLNPLPVERAKLLLAEGNLPRVVRWLSGQDLGADDQPTYIREREHLILARVLLAQHAADRAAALLARLHGLAAAQERSGSVIEISALHAVALWAAGEGDAALTTLADAVSLAQLEGYVRVFADEGPAMAALLRKLAAAARRERLPASTRIRIAYLDELLAAFEVPGDPATAGSRAVVAGLFEQLTERELEVLRLLAAGRRNDQIARELTVTLGTVKKHVTHILEKLLVTNRTEAVARARDLGLIPR